MERLKINGRKPAPVQKLQAKEKEPEPTKELGTRSFRQSARIRRDVPSGGYAYSSKYSAVN